MWPLSNHFLSRTSRIKVRGSVGQAVNPALKMAEASTVLISIVPRQTQPWPKHGA
jgi:hypothetical protein